MKVNRRLALVKEKTGLVHLLCMVTTFTNRAEITNRINEIYILLNTL